MKIKSVRFSNKIKQKENCAEQHVQKSKIILSECEELNNYIQENYIKSINQLIKDNGVYYGPQVALDYDESNLIEGREIKGVLIASVDSLLIMKEVIESIRQQKDTNFSEILYNLTKNGVEYEEEVEEEEEEEEGEFSSSYDYDTEEEEENLQNEDEKSEYDEEYSSYDYDDVSELHEVDGYVEDEKYLEED